MVHRWARSTLGVAIATTALLSGCGAEPSSSRVAVAAGSPDYALAQLAEHPLGDESYGETLAGNLPNHHYEVGDTGNVGAFSDALAVGAVTRVEKGSGVVWRDDRDYTVVGFDDPGADTRSALVTMSTDAVTGALDPGATSVTFRVLVPAQADPERFVESLAGLRRVAVVLSNDPTAIDPTPWRPIISDSLIAVIDDDGSLTLPTWRVQRASFEGDIRTSTDLLAAARAPDTTEEIPRP